MASGSLPHHLSIHNTSAAEDGQSFAGINLGTVTYASNNNSPNLNDVLKTLPTAADAPFSAYHRQHDPTCLPNTRVDLLREIHNWAGGESSPNIFWLNGLAGTGKSTIAQTVAAEYHAKGQLAGSFFFSRAGRDVSHAGKFVTSIASQLANTIPGLKRPICDAIVNRNDIASQALDEQWQELILGPFSTLDDKDSSSKYVLVVDALDECEDQSNIQIILQLLAKVQSLKALQLRVLLTSRPEVPIQFSFTQMQLDKHQDVVLHHIEPTIVEHDISLFLRHHLGLIGRECQLPAGWPEESIIERLVQNSGGLFIWAATACRFIQQDRQLAEMRLSSLIQGGNGMLPPERKLDEIYTTVLTNSVRGEYDDKETQVLRELFRQIVGPIVTLLDQLSITSLAELLGKDIDTLRRTLSNLHSVLDVSEVESNTIRLLHPSFRDFLLDQERCLNPHFYIDEKLVHREMYQTCLKVMSKHLRRDICNLRRPGSLVADLSKTEVERYIQPHVQYACRFWVYHFQRSHMEAGSYSDIKAFLREHFLHWLESLALLNCTSDAVLMIHILDSIFPRTLQSQREPRLCWKVTSSLLSCLNFKNSSVSATPTDEAHSSLQDIVHDAVRFVLTFRPLLEVAPLQVYFSSLIFSPNVSIMKKIFLNEAPSRFLCAFGVSENWSPCLQTLRGHLQPVKDIAFSSDGRTLASASYDNTVKLWDTGSGKALRTLEGHSSAVLDLAFSPNSKTLASASYDKTVKLWDTGSGKVMRTLQGHSGWVIDVAFSPEGKTLASASDDKTIKLWDTGSGKAMRTLQGHSSGVLDVAFSPDGKTLASASIDETVKLWDTGSGKAMRTLQGNSIGVLDLAFSPDGRTLASASYDKTIKLWDTSGNALHTLQGHSSRVFNVAFSPDGRTLASASTDNTVKHWDTGSGKALRTLQGHSSGVLDVAFSPDGKTLASASIDKTVKLWDTGSGKAMGTLQGHSSGVLDLAFSPDGKTLASVSEDKTIKLWDTGSGKALRTLKRHSDCVNSIAFSPDGRMLASASDDRTVKLWDTDSGKELPKLKTYSGWIEDVVLSLSDAPSNVALSQQPSPPLISFEDEWVLRKGERFLWLPSEYRSRTVAVHDNLVGFGYSSGQVLILNFISADST